MKTESLPPKWESKLDNVRIEIRRRRDEISTLKHQRKTAKACLQFVGIEQATPGPCKPATDNTILGDPTSVHPKWHIYFGKPDHPDYDKVQLEFREKEFKTKLIHECRYLLALKTVERFLAGGWRNYYPRKRDARSPNELTRCQLYRGPP